MSTSLKQNLFNKVSKHLLKQNVQSFDENGSCAYRGSEGLVCAIGCLIADKHYTTTLENHSPTYTPVARAIEKSQGLKPGTLVNQESLLLFLDGLQSIHDSVKPPEWKAELKKVAKRAKLKLPACLKPAAKKSI